MCDFLILMIYNACKYTLFSSLFPLYNSKIFFFLFSYCRLVEEVKLRAKQLQLQNEDVYMAASFQEFIQMCVRKLRGEDEEDEFNVDYVSITPVKWIVAYYYMRFR